jgi:hypothetical protein
MKIKNKFSIVLPVLMALTMVSCDKWLELKPLDGIIREEFWQTKEQVAAAVSGIYASMMGGTTSTNIDIERPLPEYFYLWGEARADMMSPTARASNEEIEFTTLNILPTNRIVNWRFVYQTINYCNTVIRLAPGVRERDNTFTQQNLDAALGQALGVRALMYFYLVRTFRDVPLKLEPTISDQDLAPMAKSPASEILNQIIEDLKRAETLTPITYGNLNIDKGRITRFAVNSLLADVYLWMDRYNECIAECDKVINSNRFGLVLGDATWFDRLYVQGNSAEHIFSLQFDNQKLNSFFFMHTTSNRRWSAASHLMENVFGLDIVNFPPLSDLRGDGASLRASDLTIWKYVGANNNNSLRTAEQSFAHWPFYRFAEVLMMKAEALNELNRPLDAWGIVKTIRQRANAFDFAGLPDSTSKTAMQDFILEERQREFAFEGKRYYDVLRVAKRNNYQRLDLMLNMAGISVPPDRQQSAFAKLRDFNSHYLPIFFYELQTNPLLTQNPFYN